MLTPQQFNKTVKGDGVGFKTNDMKPMLRIPARAEAQHMQIIGDTGAGKSRSNVSGAPPGPEPGRCSHCL